MKSIQLGGAPDPPQKKKKKANSKQPAKSRKKAEFEIKEQDFKRGGREKVRLPSLALPVRIWFVALSPKLKAIAAAIAISAFELDIPIQDALSAEDDFHSFVDEVNLSKWRSLIAEHVEGAARDVDIEIDIGETAMESLKRNVLQGRDVRDSIISIGATGDDEEWRYLRELVGNDNAEISQAALEALGLSDDQDFLLNYEPPKDDFARIRSKLLGLGYCMPEAAGKLATEVLEKRKNYQLRKAAVMMLRAIGSKKELISVIAKKRPETPTDFLIECLLGCYGTDSEAAQRALNNAALREENNDELRAVALLGAAACPLKKTTDLVDAIIDDSGVYHEDLVESAIYSASIFGRSDLAPKIEDIAKSTTSKIVKRSAVSVTNYWLLRSAE